MIVPHSGEVPGLGASSGEDRPRIRETESSVHRRQWWAAPVTGSWGFRTIAFRDPRNSVYAFNFSIGRLRPLPFVAAPGPPYLLNYSCSRTMAETALDKGKGRARPEDLEEETTAQEEAAVNASSGSSQSDSDSDSDSSDSDSDTSSDSNSDSESEDDVTPEFLESLLERARQNARAKAKAKAEARSPCADGALSCPIILSSHVFPPRITDMIMMRA